MQHIGGEPEAAARIMPFPGIAGAHALVTTATAATLTSPVFVPQLVNYESDRRRQSRRADDEMTLRGLDQGIDVKPLPPVGAALKRAIDVLGAVCGIMLLAPIFLATMISVKMTSDGPIFFSQVRLTKGGRTFRMWKFRTMVVNAEALKATLAAQNEMSGPVFKIKKDPRITKVGGFLRKTSVDELPQLWNVLIGDMSLVGPRPPVPQEVVQYRAWQARRLAVKGGITCIWQVSGRNEIDFENWMRLDLRYVDNWSLALDLKLLVKTAMVVLTGRGAS